MSKKLVAPTLMLLLVALLLASVETYNAEWSVNHSVGAAKSSPTEGIFTINWGELLIAPLKTAAASPAICNRFTQVLTDQFSKASLHATLAPREIAAPEQGFDAVALFLSLQEWEVKRSLTGWTARATVHLESLRLLDKADEMNLKLTINVAAAGRYRGWLKRSTVERQLAEKISESIVNGIADQLRKEGMHLPQVAQQPQKNGLFFNIHFGSRQTPSTDWPVQHGRSHPMLLQEAQIDYYWDLPQKTVLAYRINTTGTALEASFEPLMESSQSYEHFVDSVNQRRKLFSTFEISHWDPTFRGERVSFQDSYSQRQAETFERYVFVVAPKE